jgi:hypothetical protein
MAVAEYLLKKAADIVFDRLSQMVRKSDGTLRVSKDDLEGALLFHLRGLKTRATDISFSDLRMAKRVLLQIARPERRHRTYPVGATQRCRRLCG